MYRYLQSVGVVSALIMLLSVFLVSRSAVLMAEEQPGFLTAEELINFYTPVEQTGEEQSEEEPAVGDQSRTRGVENDADDVRGLGGVRKSKATGSAAQQAGRSNDQPARRQSFLNILFGINSVNLKQESYRQLDEIGKALGVIMAQHSAATFVVEGHTDSMGSESRNQVLSLNRAEAIRKYLIGRFGFDENRITSIGHGERSPVASNGTEAGRMLNRRVEIVGN